MRNVYYDVVGFVIAAAGRFFGPSTAWLLPYEVRTQASILGCADNYRTREFVSYLCNNERGATLWAVRDAIVTENAQADRANEGDVLNFAMAEAWQLKIHRLFSHFKHLAKPLDATRHKQRSKSTLQRGTMDTACLSIQAFSLNSPSLASQYVRRKS